MQILQVCGWQEMHSKTSCEKAYSTHCPAPDTSQPQVELREESPNIKSVEKNDTHPETRNKTGRKIVDGLEPRGVWALELEQEVWLLQEQGWKHCVPGGDWHYISAYNQVLSEYPLVRKWSQSKLYLDACNISFFALLDLKGSLDKEHKLNEALHGI